MRQPRPVPGRVRRAIKQAAKDLFGFQKAAQGRPDPGLTARSQEAREWFRDKALSTVRVNRTKMLKERRKNSVTSTNLTSVGKMHMFFYDAKLKAELPYWDKFPVIFIIEIYNDGFLGINLHYLPPVLRAKLMDALYTTMTGNDDDNRKLRITYSILKNASRFRLFKPCIKRYLSSHIASRMVEVEPSEWDYIMMLPTQQFQKASAAEVWADSMSKIRQ